MARIFIDGFESGDYDLYEASHADAAVISSAGKDMDGSYCLDATTNFAYVQKAITATDEIYTAFLWRPTAPATHQPILLFYSGGTYLLSIFRNNSTNKLQLYRGLTIVATGTKSISNDTTYLIETYFKLADSGGRFVVKVDSVTDIDFTGDTKNDANTTFDKVRLGYYSSSFYAKAYFDNFIIDDSAWIGDTNIISLVPTGAGNTTDWTPSVGNNWACVDEIPANDADYVASSLANDRDTYILEDLIGNKDIKCVQVQNRSRYITLVKNINLVVRSGGTDYLSGDKVLFITAYSNYNIWDTDPADSAVWEKADVNAIEIGVNAAAANYAIQSYQMLAQVEWIESAGIDETLRSLTIVSTVSETDIQVYLAENRSISITSTISETDFQAYSDRQLSVVVLVTTSIGNEFMGFDELSRLVNLNLNISETDIQAYKDLQTLVSSTLTPSVSDIQTYIDTGLAISSTLTVSVFDSIPYNDTDLLVSITSAISVADNQGYTEILTIPLLMGVTKTDIQTYIDDMTISMSVSVALTDTVYEQMLISMAMSLAAIDGYATDTTRQAYELISREKSFELIGRTKTYYLEKE